MLKNLPALQETQVRSLGQEDPLEEGMATHSNILGNNPISKLGHILKYWGLGIQNIFERHISTHSMYQWINKL